MTVFLTFVFVLPLWANIVIRWLTKNVDTYMSNYRLMFITFFFHSFASNTMEVMFRDVDSWFFYLVGNDEIIITKG